MPTTTRATRDDLRTNAAETRPKHEPMCRPDVICSQLLVDEVEFHRPARPRRGYGRTRGRSSSCGHIRGRLPYVIRRVMPATLAPRCIVTGYSIVQAERALTSPGSDSSRHVGYRIGAGSRATVPRRSITRTSLSPTNGAPASPAPTRQIRRASSREESFVRVIGRQYECATNTNATFNRIRGAQGQNVHVAVLR